jgi:DNA-binding MarR family transcriptional regulator
MTSDLTTAEYRRLADLRRGLRDFLHWSGERARAAGLTPTQHQLLLVIRASRQKHGPTIGEIADALLIRPHSAVELVDRAQGAGLIHRDRDAALVRLTLTGEGAAKLRSLSQAHQRELAQLAPTMRALWDTLAAGDPEPPR